MYFYDEEGSPIAVEYREPSYSATQYDVFTLVNVYGINEYSSFVINNTIRSWQ